MTTSAEINPNEIDAEYPVAGVDNDSQGFRDNFNIIKNSISAAKSAIIALENTTAKLNVDNDFNGSVIRDGQFQSNVETIYPVGNVIASQTISFTNGHYQIIQVGADITLTLTDWPQAEMARIRLQITADENTDSDGRIVTWESEAFGGLSEFKSSDNWPDTFTVFNNFDPVIVDFWTSNGGLTVFRQYHGLFI